MGIFKKIFRPIRKVLDKVVPNEIKPFLPYASAALPFLMPAAASGSFLNSMMGRALLTGGANIGSQLAQEGADDDINWLSAALAGTTGALSAPGASDYLTGLTTKGGLADMGIIGSDARTALANRNFLTKASDFGLTSLAKGADFISGAGKTLRNPKMNMETVKAAAIPFTQGTGDAMAFEAESAMREYEKALAAYNAEQGSFGTDEGRREAILTAMRAYNHPEELIEETLAELGLKDGGRVGLSFGGIPAAVQAVKDDTYKEDMALLEMDIDWVSLAQEFEETFNRPHQNDKELFDFYRDKYGADGIAQRTEMEESFTETAANGGIMSQRKPFVSGGIGKGLLKLFSKSDDAADIAQQTKTFKEGPITAKFLETVDEGVINPAIRTRDMGGSGGYGLYKNFREMPAGLQAAELISRIKRADGTIDYEAAEIFIGRKLRGNETIDELIAMVVRPQNIEAADGGIMNYNMGGSVLPDGIEVDYRGGGFIPMGSKERADDVPARVSKNEFVMTADAVRAAGGGSVQQGAKKMYELMNNLEARA